MDGKRRRDCAVLRIYPARHPIFVDLSTRLTQASDERGIRPEAYRAKDSLIGSSGDFIEPATRVVR